mmetsp:Transcript_2252/g.5048  ORF Transcript_2252/g.5048 Transcript_2252/m.5048 type:complete len:208 (-) Transcript_2252:3776-4399(-)
MAKLDGRLSSTYGSNWIESTSSAISVLGATAGAVILLGSRMVMDAAEETSDICVSSLFLPPDVHRWYMSCCISCPSVPSCCAALAYELPRVSWGMMLVLRVSGVSCCMLATISDLLLRCVSKVPQPGVRGAGTRDGGGPCWPWYCPEAGGAIWGAHDGSTGIEAVCFLLFSWDAVGSCTEGPEVPGSVPEEAWGSSGLGASMGAEQL